MCHVPGPRGNSLFSGLFLPQQGIVSMLFLRRRAPADLSIAPYHRAKPIYLPSNASVSPIFESLVSSCMLAVVVQHHKTASKTDVMYFPSPRLRYTDGNTTNLPVDYTGSISFTESFRYLGLSIHYPLTSDADVDYRISKASAALGALSNVLLNKHVSNHLTGEVYKALVLSTLLYGCEDVRFGAYFIRLRSFHMRCVVSMWHGTLRTSFWIVGARSASLSPSSIWGHCFIATYQIIMAWMLESRKPPRPLVRYVIISSVLAMCLSGSKGRFTLVVFWRCCCMGANRGASRLSPSLACATGITNAYVKCAG